MKRQLRRALGLRTRVLLALLFTAATTLAIAALALLSPLQDRLREADADAVRQTALATRPQLQDALRAENGVGRRTQAVLDSLADRTNARVLLYDGTPGSAAMYPVLELRDNQIGDTAVDDVLRVWISGRTVDSVSDQEGTRIAIPLLRRGGVVPWILALRKPAEEPSEAFATVRDAFTTAALLSLLVAAALGLALSSALVRRLGRLRSSALRMADEGPEAPTPIDRGQDEIGDLARAFAAMQKALRRQEEARRAFVATASHELRTPLTSLQGNLELLAEDLDAGHLDVDDAREQIAAAQAQLRRLGGLATELLELSRLDAGVELRLEPLELGELVRAVAAEFELRAAEQDVTLDVAPPIASIWARADPGAVARVVRILLDNALRLSPSGAAVRITTAYHGETAVVSVADEGPGVPESERDAIFERFRRGSHTGGEGGFGLGLAIGRELAVRMAGTLELRPDGDSPGARFALTLPIEEPPA